VSACGGTFGGLSRTTSVFVEFSAAAFLDFVRLWRLMAAVFGLCPLCSRFSSGLGLILGFFFGCGGWFLSAYGGIFSGIFWT
jgi:hypothetical protein